MICYKLFRQKKDGNITSLFINKTKNLEKNVWLKSKNYPTKGFAVRAGWHTTSKPIAPHLSNKGRVWYKVEIDNYISLQRPKGQGGLWYLAKRMKILNKI